MKMTMPVAASLSVLFAVAPAWAGCDEELAALDGLVRSQATEAVATSSGGQGVAGKRNSEAMAARDSDRPVTTAETGPAGGPNEARVTSHAARAGGSGDRVMQAKVSINEARVAKGKNDETGCMAAAAKAKAQLKD